MRFALSKRPVKDPVFPQGGVYYRFRPLVDVEIIGPTGRKWVKATLDSGSDDTILPFALAEELGVDLTDAPRGRSSAVGGARFEYPYARVGLRLAAANGDETFLWYTFVGFSDAREKAGLLGQSGTLEHFDVTFDYYNKLITVVPNSAFPGRWLIRRQ